MNADRKDLAVVLRETGGKYNQTGTINIGGKRNLICPDGEKLLILQSKDNETYLCLACVGATDRQGMVKHLEKFHCQTGNEGEELCPTCHCIAGTGTEASHLHFTSRRHNQIVERKRGFVCLDCARPYSQGHMCSNKISYEDLIGEFGLESEIITRKSDIRDQDHHTKAELGSKCDAKQADNIVTFISTTGKKIPNTGDVTSPPLCEAHLATFGVTKHTAIPRIQVLEAQNITDCHACKNSARLRSLEFVKSKCYFLATDIANLKVFQIPQQQQEEEDNLPEVVSPADFAQLSKADMVKFTFNNDCFMFVRNDVLAKQKKNIAKEKKERLNEKGHQKSRSQAAADDLYREEQNERQQPFQESGLYRGPEQTGTIPKASQAKSPQPSPSSSEDDTDGIRAGGFSFDGSQGKQTETTTDVEKEKDETTAVVPVKTESAPTTSKGAAANKTANKSLEEQKQASGQPQRVWASKQRCSVVDENGKQCNSFPFNGKTECFTHLHGAMMSSLKKEAVNSGLPGSTPRPTMDSLKKK